MKHNTAHLIMVMGLPGSGKTYFAKALARHIGAVHFNSDRIRKEQDARPDYMPDDKTKVYDNMFARVIENLSRGERVIVDATFSRASYRAPYFDWARQHEMPLHIIYLEASESTIKERVSKKREDSDADFAVYQIIKSEYEEITEDHLVLHSDQGDVEDRISEAMEYIGLQSAKS